MKTREMRVSLPGTEAAIDLNPDASVPDVQRQYEFNGGQYVVVRGRNLQPGETVRHEFAVSHPGTLLVDATMHSRTGGGLRLRRPKDPTKADWLPMNHPVPLGTMALRPTGADPVALSPQFSGLDLLDAAVADRMQLGRQQVGLSTETQKYSAAIMLATALQSFDEYMTFGVDPRVSGETRRVIGLLGMENALPYASSRGSQETAVIMYHKTLLPILHGLAMPIMTPNTAERFEPPTRRLAVRHALARTTKLLSRTVAAADAQAVTT